jgi:hypothetical protein
MRIVAAAISVAGLILSSNPILAQGSEPKAGSQRQPGTDAEVRKKTDMFAEAARLLSGPAGNPECFDLGWKTLVLLSRDDLDTAFRHMELYDRFGCPFGHIQAAYRCFLLQINAEKAAAEKAQGATDKSQSTPDKTDVKVGAQACWITPTPEPVPPPSASVPSTTTNR